MDLKTRFRGLRGPNKYNRYNNKYEYNMNRPQSYKIQRYPPDSWCIAMRGTIAITFTGKSSIKKVRHLWTEYMFREVFSV